MEAVSAFALAVSNSHVQTLALSTNRTLGDAFIAQFMPLLSCPHLEVLHFSAIGLSALSAPYLVDYLLAPRSRPLSCLTLNGNQLNYPAIQAIIAAVQQGNFHLTKLEMFSNCFVRPDGTPSEDSEESTSMSSWRQSQDRLKDLLWRNDYLARAVQSEALGMLRYCRLFLLRPQNRHHVLSESEDDLSSDSSTESHRTDAFARLPLELQHHILAFLAPTPRRRVAACSPCRALRRAGIRVFLLWTTRRRTPSMSQKRRWKRIVHIYMARSMSAMRPFLQRQRPLRRRLRAQALVLRRRPR
ncbi:hypothetical protein EWM64_g7985 [Hericium alpestre]|uniref:F-box domain-containing protein n=1 Tax=Hericium alpestre TaxID=135208 RepID=A0A4Y9ZRC1_9AGAM|nr:hypothetical protein EWM64_g7985 [Hericium alpestre]